MSDYKVGVDVGVGESIGVEDRYELAVREGERVVEVSGLGVAVLGASDVRATEVVGEFA